MSPERAEAAATVHAAAFPSSGPGRPWTANEIRAFCDTPGAFALTAPDAMLLGRMAGPEAELITLAVHPRARRQGRARALLAEFADRARAMGADTAFLEVAEGNAAARALYAAAGWRCAGRRRGYYARSDGAEDALLLSLNLI
ncbi:MAG: GNAT family N-acetyltransferase [Pseudomonadota bacterium]